MPSPPGASPHDPAALPGPLDAPAWAVGGLYREVVEQLMRICDDATVVLSVSGAEPGSRRAHAALGRAMSSVSISLLDGSPVVAWLTGAELSASWREDFPAGEQSLWSQLEFLRALTADADIDAGDPLEELLERSLLADD